MAIDVICTGCHKRFQVSEQFAGQKGPCPGCKTMIEIPNLEDIVVVHERETTKTGAPARIDSIKRQKTTVNKSEFILAVAAFSMGLIVALITRFTLSEANQHPGMLLAISAGCLLGIGTSLLGYIVLRGQDTEIRNDRKTIIKGCLVGVLYTFFWRLQELITSGVLTPDGNIILPGVIILVITLVVIASFVPMAVFEFEYTQGLVHVILFISALAIYSLILGDIALIIK
ncbi:MAG: hypothetical protein CMJ76_09325 [Planctomycetaceae bacterium]|nr:hypothetical protein [Planctomycetaceae bacterium]|tara:strand:- start:584 stop:1270 length:687 start_codon:yes stop_codon:yes gene_type:complete